jgi:putative membrane-bound dehydrogenase-like protein
LLWASSFALLLSHWPAAARAEGPLTPDEAQRRFHVAEGLEVKLFASEPLVRQPVTMTFDDRGRVWVIQYLQYPAPAGLKPVEVDQYLRTKYDRRPEPPPLGPKGADRITILEDTDGDGVADKAKDFVTGLNLASALALGDGGVYVGQAPYLLFYPDRNGDDVPDGDPEVLLTGFGMEDAHAVVNSLVWGPDGWLYGAQGSTVTADIRGIGFQQGIWRYHPPTKKFELFAEGGGNTWGVDFDRHGNVLAGTNFGGAVLLHQVQGGYYIKGFAKHGPLHNPHTYGYFEHAAHEGWRGGHVTCGGIVYQGTALGEKFANSYIAANLLSNAIYWHSIEPRGSTFKTRHAGELLTTDDVWFRPIDCLAGPDGALWIADWYDVRANHVIPEDTWDKSNGRIWRVQRQGARPAVPLDLAKRSSDELIALLASDNDWQVRQARRLLSERRDPATWPKLRELVERSGREDVALESLWALYASGGWDAALGEKLLSHSSADVRAWAVRLLGDEREVSDAALASLVELARREPQPAVRSQLASTARRLPGAAALAIVRALSDRSEDNDDPHIPLLLWWAIEAQAASQREQVLAEFTGPQAWKLPLVSEKIAPRLIRRYAALGDDAGYAACARLLESAPSDAARRALIAAMEQEFVGRRLQKIPAALEQPLAKLWTDQTADPQTIRFALRLGSDPALAKSLAMIADKAQPEAARLMLIEAVGQAGSTSAVDVLLPLVASGNSDAVRQAALAALEHFGDERIGQQVVAAYAQLSAALRGRAIGLLASRKASAQLLIEAIERGQIKPADVAVDQLRRILLHGDADLAAAIDLRWGKIRTATPGEKTAEIVVLNRAISEGKGQKESGHKLFVKHCAVCHVLHGEGAKIGPDLSAADRRNRGLMLLNIVDPSNSIRPEYVAQTIVTTDGRILTGIVVEAGEQAITLVDAKNQRTTIARDEIDEMRASAQSLMPERLLEQLQPQELCDLFSYFEADGPAAVPAGK